MNALAAQPDPSARPVSPAVTLLRSPATVRERCGQLLTRARADGSQWWTVHDDALARASDDVVSVTRQRYPDLVIPFHSRWRHFEVGGVDRLAELDGMLDAHGPAEYARTLIDLVVVSVLLDAGAGPDWSYHERATGRGFARSEGLGVASWHAFTTGLFSADPARPLRADAHGLRAVTVDALAAAFQVRPDNPLVGLHGRVEVLQRLGDALATRSDVFGPDARPGAIFDRLVPNPSAANTVAAGDILALLLDALESIWPASNVVDGHPLGDCWRHEAVTGPGDSARWVPFHKLSQWLTYSLLEPFRWAGVKVVGLDALTALPEYRNGGLLFDSGVLRLREPGWAKSSWAVGDSLVVEWRAMTVALVDELAALVRERLELSPERLPLACVLEGGTWATGRALAGRRGGLPPLSIASDGTVF